MSSFSQVFLYAAVWFCCIRSAVSVASSTTVISSNRDPDFDEESQLEIDRDLERKQPRLLDHHWGFFISGITVIRVAETRFEKVCEKIVGVSSAGDEVSIPPEHVPIAIGRNKKSKIVAQCLIDVGLSYSNTHGGVLFEAMPHGVSIETLPFGVLLNEFKYNDHEAVKST